VPAKFYATVIFWQIKTSLLSETLRKEIISLSFYPYKTKDTLLKHCESVIVGYIL